MTRSANKKIAIAAALVATIASTMPASAWVAYHDAGAWRGPAGGVHTYNNYGVAGAPRYGYGYHYGAWGAPAYGAGAVAAGVAAGAVAGAVVGATVASLPHACAPYGALYACGGVYYQPYYGPTGLVYQVVPAP